MDEIEPLKHPQNEKSWMVAHRVLLPEEITTPRIRQDADEEQGVLTQGNQTYRLSFHSGLILTRDETGTRFVVEVVVPSDMTGVWHLDLTLYDAEGPLLYESSTDFTMPSGSNKVVRPWHLILPRFGRSTPQQYEQRLSICHKCDRFSKGICMECGCVMKAKCSLADARCPLNRW